jgi:ABC-type uncharacterized transport system involved in gliding motility auxiliary subunit
MRLLREGLHTTLLLVAFALAGWLSVQWQWRVDVSAGQRASLAPASRAALEALPGQLRVTSYAREDGSLREAIARFIARYREHKPELELRFVDPTLDPGAMRERGITVDGEIVLDYRERSQRLSVLREREFTAALIKLARGRERVLAFLEGHGERRPDGEANHDYARLTAALAAEGVRALSLDLIEQGGVPANVDALVLASPRVALTAAESVAIVGYVEAGGALLWLTEPGASNAPTGLETALGIRVLAGTTVDATGQRLGLGDPSFVALTEYPQHAALAGFTLTTLLPQAAALAQAGDRFAIAPLLRTSVRSWTESGAIADQIAYEAEAGELPGPHDLALALERLSPRPDRGRQRVVVLGDGDLWSNQFLGNGGNLELARRIVNWLLDDEALIDIPVHEAADRTLTLSPAFVSAFGLAFLVLLPLLLLAAGAVIAWRRARR